MKSKKESGVKVGRTIKTKDKYLPVDKRGKSSKPKDKRWIAVIELNAAGELAVVKLTTEEQANTTKLKGYKHGNGKTTYFKHFVEIEDNEGNPIKVDGVKFVANSKKYDLNDEQVAQVTDKVLNHSKMSSENRKKITKLKQKNEIGLTTYLWSGFLYRQGARHFSLTCIQP